MEMLDTPVEKKKKANKTIRFRTLLATGAGFIPLPLLDADAHGQIEHIAALLAAYPEATIKLYGDTDRPENGQAANRQLGQNRAKAIENLLKQHGIKGRRIDTGFRETPVPPTGPAGVEVEVFKR